MSQQKPTAEKVRTRGKGGAAGLSLSQPPPQQKSPTTKTTPGNKTEPRAESRGSTGQHTNEILERFDRLDKAISELTDAAKINADELKDIRHILENTQLEQRTTIRKLQIAEHEIKMATANNNMLRERINNLENVSKIRNLRLDGKREEEGEDLIKYLSDLAQFLTARNNIQIITAYRIGKKQNGAVNGNGAGYRRTDRPRTILFSLSNVNDRNAMYFARTKLKGAISYPGIFLNDDVSVDTRKAREDFRSVAALARDEGAAVRMHSDGIIIDGKKYKLTEPCALPERYSLSKAKTITIDDEIYFHSEHSHLSNFFCAPIVSEGVVYKTGEHFYQAEKCRRANDSNTRNQVILAPSPLEAKRLGDTVGDTAEWRRVREDVMIKVVNEKYEQNPELAELLRKTGEKQLLEATNNSFYGIGATLQSREIRDKSYRGMNKLGIMLMAKRDELNNRKDN